MHRAPKDFLVISGDDALTVPIIAVGGAGVISVVANAFPQQYAEMVQAALNNDYILAQKHHGKLLKFTNQIFSEGNPSGIKSALESMGVCKKYVRIPLVQASAKLTAEISESIQILQN